MNTEQGDIFPHSQEINVLLKLGGDLVPARPEEIIKGGSIILDNGLIITGPTILGNPPYCIEPQEELPHNVDTGIIMVASIVVEIVDEDGMTSQIVTQYELKPRVLLRDKRIVQLMVQAPEYTKGLTPLTWEVAVKEPPTHTVLKITRGKA